MENPLLMLLKAFECESWANQFLDGWLYCNTLAFHRKKDENEATVVIPGSDITEAKIEPLDFLKDAKVESIKIRPNAAHYINIFCMYSWRPPFDDSAKEKVILNKKTQLGGLRTLEDTYGQYAVVVTKLPDFFQRITDAVRRRHSPIRGGRGDIVKYELMNRYPKNEEEMLELAFHKDPRFAGESEFRLAFMASRDIPGQFEYSPGWFKLNIGSIRDIAALSRTRDLYESIRVNGSKNF